MRTKKLLFSFILFSVLLVGCDTSSRTGKSTSTPPESSALESSSTNGEQSEEPSIDPNLDTYFVSFWTSTTASDPYAEYELAEGTPITFPTPPVSDDYTFGGWYLEGAPLPFAEGTPIYDDTDLYAKWVGESTTDGKYQIVGELENSDFDEVSWDTTSPQSFFEVAAPGEYFLRIELGYGAEFKVRETEMGWDGLVLGYDDINENDRTNYISSGDMGNVRIESAGTYLIELIPSENYLYVEVVSSMVSGGATLEDTPEFIGLRLIGDLQVSGSKVTWDIEPYDESSLLLSTDNYNINFALEVEINEGGAFKIKEPGLDWNEGLEINYGNIYNNDRRSYMSRGENNNVVINESGLYLIQVTVNRAVPKLVILQRQV